MIDPTFTCPRCRRWRNSRGLPFKTEQAVQDHLRTCKRRPPLSSHSMGSKQETAAELGLEMADLLAGDESDGVFWGFAFDYDEI